MKKTQNILSSLLGIFGLILIIDLLFPNLFGERTISFVLYTDILLLIAVTVLLAISNGKYEEKYKEALVKLENAGYIEMHLNALMAEDYFSIPGSHLEKILERLDTVGQPIKEFQKKIALKVQDEINSLPSEKQQPFSAIATLLEELDMEQSYGPYTDGILMEIVEQCKKEIIAAAETEYLHLSTLGSTFPAMFLDTMESIEIFFNMQLRKIIENKTSVAEA